MDIEQEFQKLIQEALAKIRAKQEAGEYQVWEAGPLMEKFNGILDHGDTSRYGERCPHGHSDLDCGWSPSMGYHCS